MSEKVSALLPVRDGMPYLQAAVQSLQSQARRLDEIVVVDDGSQDETTVFCETRQRRIRACESSLSRQPDWLRR